MTTSTLTNRNKKKVGKGTMNKGNKKIEEVAQKQAVQNFDQMPIGKTEFNISEFPEE